MIKRNSLSLIGNTFLTGILVIFVMSCGNMNNNNNQESDNVDTNDSKPLEQVKKLVYPIPTPLETTDMLNKAGASYILDITNPVKRVDKYFTEASKALNLGVYGADLSYASTYNKIQETNDFLAATIKLKDGLEIYVPGDVSLAKRVEANIENKDSIFNILSGSFHHTFKYLNDNGKGAVSAMVIVGGWIEGLYLATELAGLTENNTEILNGIAQQKSTLLKLIPLVQNYKDNKDIQSVLKKLEDINVIYQTIEEKEGKFDMTKEQFTKIKLEIEALRKQIVEKT